MLKKLFIHEWRSFWKLPAFMCLFALVYALIGALTFQTELWNTENPVIQFFLVFGSIGYFIVLIAPAIVLLIYTALRFYRNFYTDEGYLMHTLPVKKWQLITAKGLVAVIWQFITILATCLAVILVVLLISISSEYGGITWKDFSEGFSLFCQETVPLIKEMFAMPFALVVLLFLGNSIVSSFYSILMVYAAVSIGHLWKKHPMAGTVFSYIGFYVAASLISGAFSADRLSKFMGSNLFIASYDLETTALYNSIGEYFLQTLGNSYLTSAVGILIFYAITEWIMSHKLNLD